MGVFDWFREREKRRAAERRQALFVKQASSLLANLREKSDTIETVLSILRLTEEQSYHSKTLADLRETIHAALAEAAADPTVLSAIISQFAKKRNYTTVYTMALSTAPTAAQFIVETAMKDPPGRPAYLGGDPIQESAGRLIDRTAEQKDLRHCGFLIEKLDSPDQVMFETALSHLVRYGDTILEHIFSAYRTGSERQRAGAVYLLGRLLGKTGNPVVEEMWNASLTDRSAFVVKQAVRTASVDKLPQLLNLLNSPNFDIASGVIRKLEDWGDARSVDRLVESIVHEWEGHFYANGALDKIAQKNPDLRIDIEKKKGWAEAEQKRRKALNTVAKIPASERVAALCDAAKYGRTAEVRALLDLGADPNERKESGIAPLLAAALGPAQSDPEPFWRLDTIKLLLERGAKVDLQDPDGHTPLWFAVFKGRIDIAGALIGSGANPNLSPTGGPSPLELARQNGFREIIEVLTHK